MIHFHHQTTFQTLPFSTVVTHIGIEVMSFTRTTGKWTAPSCQNYSLHTNLEHNIIPKSSQSLNKFLFTANISVPYEAQIYAYK